MHESTKFSNIPKGKPKIDKQIKISGRMDFNDDSNVGVN